MSDESRDVTLEYQRATQAAETFDPGQQPDIGALLKSAYIHGYAHALIEADAFSLCKELAEALDGLKTALKLEDDGQNRVYFDSADAALAKYRELVK